MMFFKKGAEGKESTSDKLHGTLSAVDNILGVFTSTVAGLKGETDKLVKIVDESNEIAKKHLEVSEQATGEINRINKIVDKLENIVGGNE